MDPVSPRLAPAPRKDTPSDRSVVEQIIAVPREVVGAIERRIDHQAVIAAVDLPAQALGDVIGVGGTIAKNIATPVLGVGKEIATPVIGVFRNFLDAVRGRRNAP